MYESGRHAADRGAPRLLRLRPDVVGKVNLGPTRLYELIKAKAFPTPIKVGRASLFVESEVDDWIAARVAERDADKPATQKVSLRSKLAAQQSQEVADGCS